MSYWPNQMIYYLSTSGTNNLSLIPGNTVTLPTQTNLPYLSTGEIFTTGPIVFSGGDYLSTIGGELVYNGIPVVQYSTLSSLNEWSFEPAISSINVAGNNILNANITDTNIANISTGNISTINTNNISTNFITASSINTSSLNVTNLNYISTYTYTSTISSIQFEGDNADIDQMTISSLNGVPVSQVITPYTLPMNLALSTLYLNNRNNLSTLYVDGNVKTFQGIDCGSGLKINGGLYQSYQINDSNYFGCGPTTFGNATLYNAGFTVQGACVLDGGALHGTTIGCVPVLGVNTQRIDVLPAGIDMTAATYITINAAGAGNFACGGALSLAGGGYVEINTGEVQCINTTSGESLVSMNKLIGNVHNGGSGKLYLSTLSSINDVAYIPTQQFYTLPVGGDINMNLHNLTSTSIVYASNVSSATVDTYTVYAGLSVEAPIVNANDVYTSTLVVPQSGYISTAYISSIGAVNDLNFDVGGSINTNGSVVNLTGSEIHNASLIHSRNNQNLILEGKGNGIVNISSISTVVSKYFQPDSMGVSSINASSMTINNLQTSNYISSATENTVSSLSRVLQTSSILASTINAISTITTHNQVSSIFISTLCAGGLSTGQALLTLRGGNSATAVNGTPQLSFDWSQTNGGFTHWMTTRHNSMASNAGNAIDFWINNSTIYNGSTYPAIGNCNILSITGAGVGINVSSPAFALEVSGAIRNTTFISTVSSINNLVFTSTLATNTISSQLLNISTVSARAVTATALNYPAVAVTSSGNNTLTVVDTHTYLINTYGGAGNATWTLPTASSYQGRIIFIKNNAATPQIVSNANNVIPQIGGAAGTLICAAGTGKFSVIVSDGSNWVVMMSN